MAGCRLQVTSGKDRFGHRDAEDAEAGGNPKAESRTGANDERAEGPQCDSLG